MMKIPLPHGKYTIVDDEDFALLSKYRWHLDGSGYAVHNYWTEDGKCKSLRMHRVIIGVQDGLKVDHRDGNKLNNARSNLRQCTDLQNSQNCSKHFFKNNWSRFKGVSFHIRCGKWSSQIRVNGKLKHIGYFQNEEEAASAYNKAAIEHFGDFARVNMLEAVS